MPDLSKKDLQYRTATGDIHWEFDILQRIPSTNLHAKSKIDSGAAEGTVIVAEEQTAGKGRLGRTWISEPGKNLTFSIILKPGIPVEKMGNISLMAAIAVAGALEELGIKTETKWPNDLLLGGKKTCGILSELILRTDTPPAVIVGIGLNVNQTVFPAEVQDLATSLSSHAGREFDRTDILARILNAIDDWYRILQRREFASIHARWKELSTMFGKEIRLSVGASTVRGEALDLAEDAGLVVLHDGLTETFHAGDVTVVR